MPQTPVKLTVERGGKTLTLSVRPRYDTAAEQALVGFGLRRPALRASAPAKRSARRRTRSGKSLRGRVIYHPHIRIAAAQAGLGSGRESATSATRWSKRACEQALLLLALVSLSLGLINLLPILPLDGGHIFWAVVEKLRGRPVSLRVIERATVVGVALVLMLMFIGLSNDIGRITGEGFEVR